jgi:hypothetical protein
MNLTELIPNPSDVSAQFMFGKAIKDSTRVDDMLAHFDNWARQ